MKARNLPSTTSCLICHREVPGERQKLGSEEKEGRAFIFHSSIPSHCLPHPLPPAELNIEGNEVEVLKQQKWLSTRVWVTLNAGPSMTWAWDWTSLSVPPSTSYCTAFGWGLTPWHVPRFGSIAILFPGGSMVHFLRFGTWCGDLEVASFSWPCGLWSMVPILFRK